MKIIVNNKNALFWIVGKPMFVFQWELSKTKADKHNCFYTCNWICVVLISASLNERYDTKLINSINLALEGQTDKVFQIYNSYNSHKYNCFSEIEVMQFWVHYSSHRRVKAQHVFRDIFIWIYISNPIFINVFYQLN